MEQIGGFQSKTETEKESSKMVPSLDNDLFYTIFMSYVSNLHYEDKIMVPEKENRKRDMFGKFQFNSML